VDRLATLTIAAHALLGILSQTSNAFLWAHIELKAAYDRCARTGDQQQQGAP